MKKPVSGFTLTEILISLSIFSLIIAAALGLFNSAQISMETLEKQSYKLRQVQLAVRQIEDDIRHLVYRARRNEFGDKVALLRGETEGNTSFLEFTRAGWRNPAKLKRSNLQHIVYQFKDEELIRSHWLYLDNAQENQQLEKVLLSNVEAMKVEFLDDDDWKDKWQVDTDDLEKLPRAIKVTLILIDPTFGEIYRIFPIPEFDDGDKEEVAEQERRN